MISQFERPMDEQSGKRQGLHGNLSQSSGDEFVGPLPHIEEDGHGDQRPPQVPEPDSYVRDMGRLIETIAARRRRTLERWNDVDR